MAEFMSQTLFNALLSIAGAMGMWWLKTAWGEVKELSGEVKALQVLVAGKYVTREELDKAMQALFRKLDKIDDSLVGRKSSKEPSGDSRY